MNRSDYKNIIVIPALKYLEPDIPFSENAVNLILLTAIAESNLNYIAQLKNGPAKGFLQMEPETEQSIWVDYLSYRKKLYEKIDKLVPDAKGVDNLSGNLYYQVAMARLKYWPDPEKIPKSDDVRGMCNYYIRIYNGGGKATLMRTKSIYINKVLGHG